MQRSLLEMQRETNAGWMQKIGKGMFLVEGDFEESRFDLQAWMNKTAESKRCSRAVWRNGRAVEVVVQ